MISLSTADKIKEKFSESGIASVLKEGKYNESSTLNCENIVSMTESDFSNLTAIFTRFYEHCVLCTAGPNSFRKLWETKVDRR